MTKKTLPGVWNAPSRCARKRHSEALISSARSDCLHSVRAWVGVDREKHEEAGSWRLQRWTKVQQILCWTKSTNTIQPAEESNAYHSDVEVTLLDNARLLQRLDCDELPFISHARHSDKRTKGNVLWRDSKETKTDRLSVRTGALEHK
jgi:hypothetical protein